MAKHKQYEAYQNNAVQTASNGELTMMLYNGCVKFIRRAMGHIEEEAFAEKNEQIQKAQAIITELMVTLDPDVSLSNELLVLYDYAQFQLTEGNVKNDRAAVQEALTVMDELRDTWKQVMLQTRKSNYEKGAQI